MRLKQFATAFICALFLASLGMRLGAQASGDSVRAAVETLFQNETGALETSSTISALVAELSAKEAQLQEEENRIQARELELSQRESELRSGLMKLQDARAELKAAIGEAQDANDANIERLSNFYESMKPKPASEIFEIMDEKMAAGIFSRMSTDSVSAILSNMSPEKSYSVSVVMAARGLGLDARVPEKNELPEE